LLTVDFSKFPIKPGDLVLDLGCGAGRHAFEAYRRGARVIAADLDHGELPPVHGMFAAMAAEAQAAPPAAATALAADATRLPFPDDAFDAVIAAEILEHLPADTRAFTEIARVLRPGGTVAVTVPAWLPERVCWALSREYHEVPGGHVRIFTRTELTTKLTAAGLTPTGGHHAHGLHSAYWWLKCAVGVHDDAHPAVRAYHRLLVWDIMRGPALTRLAEAALNPLIGKSLVIYARKIKINSAKSVIHSTTLKERPGSTAPHHSIFPFGAPAAPGIPEPTQ
jgi:ubiquinone/menaquinone biosynthesis C-methylase UbiE